MKKIELISLTLNNFKGIKDLTINFNSNTNIYGDNATGKTTIADSFYWLLFDKDSTDRKQFEIKTLDKNNQPLHGLDHSVTGVLSINGKKKVFQKIYKEKWVKKRGESDSQFTGHETLYYVDDIPVKKNEYEYEVTSIIDESLFKLLTNPLYFSSLMKWQDRRNVLLSMNGEITNYDVFSYNKELSELELDDMDVETKRKSLQAKKRKLNDEIKAIPVRIDECSKSISEDLDFDRLKTLVQVKQTRLDIIEKKLLSYTKVDDERSEMMNRSSEIKSKLYKIEQQAKDETLNALRAAEGRLKDKEYELQERERQLKNYQDSLNRFNSEKADLEKYIEQCRKDWWTEKEKNLAFDNEQFICPTCERLLEADDIEKQKAEMLKNFNAEKVRKLDEINKKGADAAGKIKQIDVSIKNINESVKSTEEKISELKKVIEKGKAELKDFEEAANKTYSYPAEYYTLKEELAKIELELEKPANSKRETLQLISEKKQLQNEIDNIKVDLLKEENNKLLKERIKELEQRERELAKKIAEVEKQEFLCEQFIKSKVELLEQHINAKFNYVSFKLFGEQINGGLVETCEPLINGVPFSDANHAAKINAGIDIINALSQHYQCSAPIFIDNRESINEIIPPSGQVINLIVSKDKKLKII